MRFALITADQAHRVKIQMNPERDDATSFMQWASIFDGLHLSFEGVRKEGDASLRDFDVVMMSGHLNYIMDIIRIGKFLKSSQTVTMFYPEGSAQLYDNSINGFHPEYYEAWRACDILSVAEEDKKDRYYEHFIDRKNTLVAFIHVPTTLEMSGSMFFVPRTSKKKSVAVYGDNNPNHPLIALAACNNLKEFKLIEDVISLETRGADFSRIFPDLPIRQIPKQSLNPFLRILGQTIVNFYPTEWIGTARHQISCAAVGTPCIGNKDSHTQKRLFPELGVDIYDVERMVTLAIKLIDDCDFYGHVVEHARQMLSFYDMGNTVGRFLDAVNEAHRKFKGAIQAVPA